MSSWTMKRLRELLGGRNSASPQAPSASPLVEQSAQQQSDSRLSLDPEMKLSQWFKAKELTRSQTASRLQIDNRPNQAQLDNARKLAATILDPIRDQFGPIGVTSWLRVPELNRRIPGSSRRSYHQFGLAADFVPADASLDEVMQWLSASRLPFDLAIMEYGSWIHIQASIGDRTPRRLLLKKETGREYARYA